MSPEAKKGGAYPAPRLLSVAGQPAVLKNQIVHIACLGAVHTRTVPPLKYISQLVYADSGKKLHGIVLLKKYNIFMKQT